uniref:Hypothetical chloroplast RF1 n=1 Tax=Chaetophoropsis polyrhiza TaxID=2079440 RepID=A0A6H1U5Y7_9CHLO|nr:hypothetical chloroplast RF1 [Chaetophoropsis polyrhiza]QIZ74264.1 hypothetical chloroplast RF1 [Chaetophoropsis polyrhiza]
MTFFYLVKDYIEVVHKLIETSPSHVLQHSTYTDSLTILSFGLSSFKQLCINFLSFEWLKQLWYFPIIVPEIATSMLEEISVLDGNFHNILTVLDKPLAAGNIVYGNYYLPLTCFEKIFTGLINSLFIWLPTSTATFICFRRFIMQGVEAGYSAALGTMAATLFWLTSIIFGLRFIVVPWMSLDLVRYWLGFLLLMKYFWDNRYAYKEVKHNSVFGKQTRRNIFAFHFLLALTEQTSLYPFLSNFSISSQSTLLEGFPSDNIFDFTLIHFSYLLGIAIGSYSLINLLSWFWQDPAYRFYFWIMNKFKKLRVADIVRPVHLFFQSITVLFAFSSLPYFGIEYQVTNPLGFVPNDQVFHQFKKTSFLTHSTSPAYYRSRLNFPRQKFFRYEDWAEYYHRNIPLDTSLYDQGAYRLYTMEDLSYGKDYEWMRRRSDKIKIRSRLKRLRWFPRNWANRLWEFTKTWSRRNVLWRNDILNMYQYSWDSKAPIIWNKLVFEEFFPGQKSARGVEKGNQQVIPIQESTSIGKSNTNVPNISDLNTGKASLGAGDQQSNKETFLAPNKSISKSWDSFWGPDPDWTTKFLANKQSLTKTDTVLNDLSRFNVSDNDVWWKWLSNKDDLKLSSWAFLPDVNSQNNLFQQNKNVRLSNSQIGTISESKTQKQDFWKPQNRLISLYSENTNLQKQEFNLEFSTLRKFVRKLTSRFKLAKINKVSEQLENKPIWIPLSEPFTTKNGNDLRIKSLLITPSLRDWTVFQTLLANINSIVWWRRFSTFQDQSAQNCSDFCLDSKQTQLSAIPGLKQGDLLFNTKTKLPKFIKTSENKPTFEKIQAKYFEIQNRRRQFLMFNTSLKNDSQFVNFFSEAKKKERATLFEQEKLGTSLKFLQPNGLLTVTRNINTQTNTSNIPNTNLDGFWLGYKKGNRSDFSERFEFKKRLPSVESSSTLLHPVKYYLHKEQTFKRKLSFYGVKNSRSSAVSNISYVSTGNFSNVQTRSSFSDTKKLLEQINPKLEDLNNSEVGPRVLKNRQFFSLPGRQKSQSQLESNDLVDPKDLQAENSVAKSSEFGEGEFVSKNLLVRKNKNKLPIFNFYLKTYFQTYKKTKLYVLNTKMKRQLGMGASARRKGRDYSNKLLKRAKILSNTPWIRQWIDQSGFLARRKRLETWIARQHYDPNELWAKIMKTDVDLFMKRQPSSYFLTTTEENLLHLRRFLLFEYYDTLRWYTYMTNYRSMKNTIGGTKSFTNKLYNQQFKGTFHKVRHLFSLTPSVSNGSLLKFDRPLYNSDGSNQFSSGPYENGRYPNWTHEELKIGSKLPRDLLEESSKNLQQSIWKTNLTYGSEGNLSKDSNTSNMFSRNLTQNTSQNEILKNNLQKKLMIRILQLRKKQKWNIDYKRASENLWKKWKLRSNMQEAKSIPIVAPQLETHSTQQTMGLTIPFDSVSKSEVSRKLLQIKKLKLFGVLNSSVISSNTSNLNISTLNNFSRNSLLANKFFNDKTETSKQLNRAQQIFNQNIFTRKLIKHKYKKLVKNNFFLIQKIKLSKPNSLFEKSQANSARLQNSEAHKVLFLSHVGSFNIKLQKIINNRALNTLRLPRKPAENAIHIQAENSRVKNWEFLNHSKDLSTQNNIQLYEINKIRQERSNVQNYVFMKKFLVNDNFTMFTRSQLRPLPGKRTKALYDKLASVKSNDATVKRSSVSFFGKSSLKDASSGFNQYFLSSISDKNIKILFYKNRKWFDSLPLDEKLIAQKIFPPTADKRLPSQNWDNLVGANINDLRPKDDFSKTWESSGGFSNLSILNSKWKFFVNTLRNSSELVSNKLDKTLQTKLINDQNEKILTTDFSRQDKTPNRPRDYLVSPDSLISPTSENHSDFRQAVPFFDVTNVSLRDSAGLKTIAIQKLTKTLLSKQKNQNSARKSVQKSEGFLKSIYEIEQPITNRITKFGRKRQQDFVTRSLLKRHLNLKSRRKLFLKTKEINNQRTVLDRKYELQERVFLNQIGFLSDVKTGLEGESLSSEMSLNKQNDRNLISKNLLKNNTGLIEASQNSEVFWKQSDRVLGGGAKNSVLNFLRWLTISKNSYKNLQSKMIFEKKPESSTGWEKSTEIFPISETKFKIFRILQPKSSKRSTLFIDKILNQHKNDYTQKYLNNKLKQTFDTSSKVENEKSSLRRTLRKFSLGTYIPKREAAMVGNKTEPFTTHKLNTTEMSFINNLLLKNWLIRRNKLDPNDFRGRSESRYQSLSEKVNKKSENGLINLNKYIIFARTNQNKLSRQQIRKKLKKRRIIRMKRAERLKTLKDHPLKFRSDQIQTFYNIRHSLQKWKNFSFISEKTKYTKAFWERNPTTLIQSYQTSPQLSSLNSTTDLQKLKYKPLNSNLVLAPNSSADMLQTLYKDIFITSPPVEINKATSIGDRETAMKPLLINTTNLPFYAGWDESLRKFVLTNRLLNRREAGYQSSNSFRLDNTDSSNSEILSLGSRNGADSTTTGNEQNIIFAFWPLRGKNSATTLFSQFPFMTAPQTNLSYSQERIRSIKSGTKYDLQTSINLNKLSNQTINNSENDLWLENIEYFRGRFDKKWKQKSTNETQNNQGEENFPLTKSMGNTASYLNFKAMNRIKSFIKSSKNDEQIGLRQSGQVISNLANPTTRKMARHALFVGKSGATDFKKLKVLNQPEIGNQKDRPYKSDGFPFTSRKLLIFNLLKIKKGHKKFFFSKINNNANYWRLVNPDSIDKKLSTKILLFRNLRQGNRAQTKLAYIRRLQKTLRPTGSAWKTTQVLARRKKQRIKQNNFWGMPQNEAFTRFSVRKRKKRGNNKNPRLRGDKNYKKTKRQYRQKLYLRPKNKPLRRRSLGVTFKNKLNYWRRNYQNIAFKNVTSSKNFKQKNENSFERTFEKSGSPPTVLQTFSDQRKAVSFFQNLKDNSRYSQRNKEWKFLNNFETSGTRRPRQLYRSLFKNPTVQVPILYTTLPGHSRSIPLIKNLPLPGSSVKTLNRVIKWSSADGASRFYRVNLSYGWAMTLFLNNLHQKVNSENQFHKSKKPFVSESLNNLIKTYLTELETTNKTRFSSSREFKRRFYKLRQLSYTMSLRLYDRWFFYYYKNTNSNPQKEERFEVLENGKLFFDENIETNITNKIKQAIISSSAGDSVERALSPFKHIKNFLTFHISFSRKEKELENQSNFRSYLKNLRNTAYSKAQNRGTDNNQALQNTTGDDNTKSNNEKTLSMLTAQNVNQKETSSRADTEFSVLDNFKLFSIANKDSENSTSTNFSPRNLVKSNKTLLKKEKKYAEDRFFFAQFNKPPLVEDYRLTLENNRHYPLNGGFVWPGDYLRLQTILLPKEIKDLYLLKKTNTQFLKDKKNEYDLGNLSDFRAEKRND